MFKFICPRCGGEGQVPFQPSNPERILCSSCHEETGGRTFDLSKSHTAPRRRHNTRVVINIICAECKEPAELDYAPKGVSIDKMKCEKCLAKEYGGQSRWAMIRELKAKEHSYTARRTFTVKCSACKEDTELPFRPEEGRAYLCRSCYNNDGIPLGPVNRGGVKHALRPNLFVRKRGVKRESRERDRGPETLADVACEQNSRHQDEAE